MDVFFGLCSRRKYPIEGSRSFSGTYCDIHTRRGEEREEERRRRKSGPYSCTCFHFRTTSRLEVGALHILSLYLYAVRGGIPEIATNMFFEVRVGCHGCRLGLDESCKSSKLGWRCPPSSPVPFAKSPSRLDRARDSSSNEPLQLRAVDDRSLRCPRAPIPPPQLPPRCGCLLG